MHFHFFVGAWHHADGRRNVRWGGQVIDYGIDQRLHAFLLESGAAEHRHQLDLASEPANGRFERFRGDRLIFDDQLGDFVILVGDPVNQFFEVLLGRVLQVGWDFFDAVFEADVVVVVINDGPLVHHVDDALELVFLANGNDDGVSIGAELFAHLAEGIVKIRADTVHLVDEGDARDLVFGGLAPDCFRLGLHAGNAAEYRHRAIQHAHGALDFGRKIDVAGSIDDIHPVLQPGKRLVSAIVLLGPIASGCSGGNGDAALAFLLHPVGHGIAVIDITHAMDEPGVKEDALGGGRFASIDMGGNADVARTLHRILSLGRIHCSFLFQHCLHLNTYKE